MIEIKEYKHWLVRLVHERVKWWPCILPSRANRMNIMPLRRSKEARAEDKYDVVDT